MTIGVGFRCCDGIVLCSDTQMTKFDIKFQDSKLRVISPDPDRENDSGDPWVVVSTFAGGPAIHQRVLTDLSRRLLVRGHIPTFPSLQGQIEAVLSNERKHNKRGLDSLEMLFAFSVGGVFALLHSQGKEVSEVEGFHCIGAGDTSLIRFLRGILAPQPRFMWHEQCVMAGIYMIDQAREYVEGCGGTTQVVTIMPDGCLRVFSGIPVEHRQKYQRQIEQRFSQLMQSMSNHAADSATALHEFTVFLAGLGKFTEIKGKESDGRQ